MLSGPGLFGMLSLFISTVNLFWTWFQKGQTAAADRVKKTEDDILLLKTRVQQLEGDFKHLPTKDDISGLRLQLTDVMGQVRATQDQMGQVNRTVGRIDDYLREKA